MSSTDTFDLEGSARKRLLRIAPEAYRHPLDQQATQSLRSVPGFELAVSKLSRIGLERILYLQMLASSVKVTERQCGRIHKLLLEACAVLDIGTPPALFLSQMPIPNAFAFGRETPTLVLFTGVVEHLSEEELLAVIAHELGHIHCGHTIYLLMLVLIQQAAKYGGLQFGGPDIGKIISRQIEMALFAWLRKAEFSADRAAVLVTQNPDAVFSGLFKLTGGSPKVFAEMNRDEFLQQAEEYDELSNGRLDQLYKAMLESPETHPRPVVRAREVLRFGASDEYKAILSGKYLRREKNGGLGSSLASPRTCPHCGKDTDSAFSFCTHCGLTLPAPLPPAPGEDEESTSHA